MKVHSEAESFKRRFLKLDRVVCKIGAPRPWAPGTIMSINEDDPEDPTRRSKVPYVVKCDPPVGRLISVPEDVNDLVRPEVCFGQRAGALWFTLFCLPTRPSKTRRFAVGERVACAVEDATDTYTVWAAGVVLAVDPGLEPDDPEQFNEQQLRHLAGFKVPYHVQLDTGRRVFVHKDEHWLVRDLRFQAEGPRQRPKRMETQEVAGSDGKWETIDHQTRRTRAAGPPSDSESDSDSDSD